MHQRCVGCETQGRPGGTERPIEQQSRWWNRRRRSRRRGAATALEWRAPRPEPKAVVRSALAEARAEVSALVRALLHGAVRSAVHGEAGTGDARSATARSRGAARSRRSRSGRARRGLRRAGRAAPSRGGRGGERSEPPGKRSAQRPKGAEARGIPARRVETAQRARQGSPVAKRRAQTPRRDTRTRNQLRHHHHRSHRHHRLHHRLLHRHRQQHWRQHRRCRRQHRRLPIVGERCNIVKTHARALVTRFVRETMQGKSGGAAAERGACQATREAKAVAAVLEAAGKKGDRAAEATRPVVAMRSMRPPAAPGCRAPRPCRPGYR